MELSKIAKITNTALKLFILLGIITLFYINRIVTLLGLPNPQLYTIFFTILGILCLLIVHQVTKVFKSISLGNPFVTENEIALKKIAVLCEIIAIILFIKTLLYINTLLLTSILIMAVFVIAGLCAYVFSQLFKQSVIIKEENDMTI